MLKIFTVIKNLFKHPGYCYLIPECIVVGLPMASSNEYEFWLHADRHPPTKMPVRAREESAKFDPRCSKGFVFEERTDNTHYVTFDKGWWCYWTGNKKVDYSFSLYDKTNCIILLNKVKLIRKIGKPNW